MADRCPDLLLVVARPEDHEVYCRALGHDRPFECVAVSSGQEGLARCRTRPPGCVIVEHHLPDMSASRFLELLGAGAADLPVPAVVVLERGDEEAAIAAMKAGAHDYVARGASRTAIQQAVGTAMERHARLPPRTCRVLIIDDSPEDRTLYRRRLAQSPGHYEFLEADTGEAGLAACAAFRPDCVLLDYHLPDADGLEVLTGLLHHNDQLAVLVLTGQGNEAVAVRALKAGAEDYMVKGPALDALPQAVRTAVEKVSLRRRLDERQRALERSQKQLQVTLASIGDAVIATDLAGRVTYQNPVAEALTGWSTEAARGRPLEEIFVIVNEHTRQTTANPALRALREGRVVGLANHTVLIARDATERPIDDSAAPIRDMAGEVFGAVLVFRDVTERHRTEQSLLLQSRVLESMTEGVSVSDEAGIIFYTNPAEDRMLGYARGELVGQSIAARDAYPRAESERRAREVREALAASGVWTGEWHNRRADGSSFIGYARITALLAGSGRRCFVRVQEDVSHRHRLEDELQQRVDELAQAHRRKDEFLAMLAHELRNPLTPIKNALHLLALRRDDAATVDRMRELMARQVRHFGRLVDDLLDVSRVTQGKLSLKLERIELVRLVRECVADHEAEFKRASITLTAETPATPVWLTGDATRMTQILDNFLTNALKFSNVGGEVRVTVGSDDKAAELRVQDNGIGIEPEVLPTIFDVFAQADRSLARSPGGLGLGLAIIKGLVQLHGGTVVARSEGLGRGTEFVVSLPLQQEVPALAPATATAARSAAGHRVLVIEDNRDSAESLRMLLEVSGYEVKVAHTGTEGVQVATLWRPDAVICDIGLPGMDGYAVASRLRGDPATAHASLIAVTGYGRPEDIARARAAGFDEHVMKPADPEMLLAKLGAPRRAK